MKRQLIALAMGGLFALPAYANNEIDAGHVFTFESGKSRAQVRAELVAAQRAGLWVINAELGTLAKPPMMLAGKTRDQVIAELIDAQREGRTIVNAETGRTARQMYPALYAEGADGDLRATLRGYGR